MAHPIPPPALSHPIPFHLRGAPYLSAYAYDAGDSVSSSHSKALVQRLLDSAILKSCSQVFEAFDEDLLFREQQAPWWSLKKQFKGVFHNVSRVLDCVSCQKCRLHAKVTMLGFGSALKMLLLPTELISSSFTRDEVVALFNTLAKFSSAIHYVKELTQLQFDMYNKVDSTADTVPKPPFPPPKLPTARAIPATTPVAATTPIATPSPPSLSHDATVGSTVGSNPGSGIPYALLDTALGTVAAASARGVLGQQVEILVVRALQSNRRAVC